MVLEALSHRTDKRNRKILPWGRIICKLRLRVHREDCYNFLDIEPLQIRDNFCCSSAGVWVGSPRITTRKSLRSGEFKVSTRVPWNGVEDMKSRICTKRYKNRLTTTRLTMSLFVRLNISLYIFSLNSELRGSSSWGSGISSPIALRTWKKIIPVFTSW